MLKSASSLVRCWPLLALLSALFFSSSACQYAGSFDEMRCAEQQDCPGASQCVEGYCVAEVELGDVSNPAVASIALSPESATLAEGEVLEMTSSVLDAQGSAVANAELQWESTDETIASVDANGVVSALSAGTAIITASADGSLDSAAITVTPVPANAIVVEPSSLQLKPGSTASLTARLLDKDGQEIAGREVRWSSETPGVAFVDDSGTVTAIEPGSTTITATSGATQQTVDVDVLEADLVAIELTPSAVELTAGDTFGLLALVRDEFGEVVENAPITWTSSEESVALVDASGLITAVADGSATITAESGSAQATAGITVVARPVASIDLTPISATLERGTTLDLDARALAADSTVLAWPTMTFTSSNDNVASVDASGTVSAHQPGTVAITAEAGGVQKSAAISVISTQATGLSVSPSVSDIEIGQSVDLNATVQDVNGNTISDPLVVWESSDTGVALVDASGAVFGIGVGSVTVTARTNNGTEASATVNVSQRSAATIDLRPQSATIEVSQTLELAATVRASDQTILEGRTITFASSNNTVASVDSNGVVTGLAAGGPIAITATSGSASQTVNITVNPRSVVGVDVSPQLETIEVDATTTLSATPRAVDGTALLGRTISWTSDDDTVASVDPSGAVTGVAQGVTLIRALVEGKEGFASISVTPRPVASVEIPEGDQNIAKGESVHLSATTRDAGGATLTGRVVSWSSDDPNVAVVDSTGNVTGVSGGQATITATSGAISDAVLVTVTENSAPTATPQTLSTDENTSRAITLGGSDPDDDPLSFSITALAANGSLSAFDSTTGNITYTPHTDYVGTDSFTFTVSDSSGATSSASVSLTINAVNAAPIASEDTGSTSEDTPVTVDVLANDSDGDNDALSVTKTTQPASGSVAVNADGTITYTPDADFNGTDSFTYTVSDGTDADTATVSITVDPADDAPVAADDSATTDEDQSVTIDVLANDDDADGDSLSVVLATVPANGDATNNGDGTVTYVPDADFNGGDSFSYDLSDGNQTVTATVTITVTAVNDAPVADAGPDQMVAVNDTVQLDASASSDVDGDTLAYTWTVTSEPTGSAVTLSDPNAVSPTFDAGHPGAYELLLTVDDGTTSHTDTVVITAQ